MTENQTIQQAVINKTAELISASKEKDKTPDFCVGKISNDVYLPVHAEGEDPITSGWFAVTVNQKLTNRMILKKCSLETALSDAVEQYKNLYVENCAKLNIEPVSFDLWLSGVWVN